MAAFLNDQLDFIFFFYGLAFLLLGATSWAISRRRPDELPWTMLAAFGLIHGVGEWLDLGALILGDRPTYAAVRIGVMTASFVFLAEFGRLQLGGLAPRRWVYLPVIGLVVVTGYLAGLTEAGVASRYTLGLFGSLAASWALVRLTERLSGTGGFHARAAALAFTLYGLATGVIVPEAPFWPASVVNYQAFADLTGTPIQLIRGLLACWIALSVWALWGQHLASEVSSESFTAYLRRQFLWASGIMFAILLLGWLLTERLGVVYRRNVEIEAAIDIDLLASRLAGEIDVAGALVKVLAASPIIREAPEQAEGQLLAQANEILAVYVEVGRAQAGYLLNEGGATVASAGPLAHRPASEFVGAAHDDRAVEPSAGFLFDAATNMIVHFTRQPVLGGEGRAVGAVALVVSIEGFAGDLAGLNRPYFFVDPHGVVMMSNVSEAVNRTLWPLNPATLAERASLAALDLKPIGSAEMEDAAWVNFEGSRDYVRRRFIAGTDWSLIILKPTRQIFATRFVGIVITLLTAIVALMYLLGKERWMHEACPKGDPVEASRPRARHEHQGRHGSPDGAVQQAAPQGRPAAGDGADRSHRERTLRRDVRHRPLQADQRQLRPRDRGQGTRRSFPGGGGVAARHRSSGALGRRGVPRCASRRQRGGGPSRRREAPPSDREPPHRRGRRGDVQLRGCAICARRGHGGPDRAGGSSPLPGQGERPKQG
nr:GGDEF domain-containing protein [Ancylobacter novellus]